MKRLSMMIGILLLGMVAPCMGDTISLSREITDFMVMPWVTVLLTFIGMMLIISELTTSSAWGMTGTLGALCVGLVVASYVLAGVALWIGLPMLLAGLALLAMEAKVMPGRGVGMGAGLICLGLGFFWVLGGLASGAFVIPAAVLFTLMSFAAFLAYLPRNSTWKSFGRRVVVKTNHPKMKATSGHIPISESGKAAVQKIGGPDEDHEKPRSDENIGRKYQADEESKQQTIGTGQDE